MPATSSELRCLKNTLQPGEVIIHEDFAENYLIKQQHEIMQAHWYVENVTVFTTIA